MFILVPALLGLKGNLEMTLASRLSTQVSLKLINLFNYTLSALKKNHDINFYVVSNMVLSFRCLSNLINDIFM